MAKSGSKRRPHPPSARRWKTGIKAVMDKLGIKCDPHQMCGLMFDWIVAKNNATISNLVQEGDRSGERHVIIIEELGVDEQGDVEVGFSSGTMASLGQHFSSRGAEGASGGQR